MPFKPTDEDKILWAHQTKGIKRLNEVQDVSLVQSPPLKKKKNKEVSSSKNDLNMTYSQSDQSGSKKVQDNPQLNRRDADRLRRGQFEIEASLDLHGLTQAQAQLHLRDFIMNAVYQKFRCVLVITGKGRLSEPSILKQNFPVWLKESPLNEHILQIQQARPKDGGSGAFYVYLKRVRDTSL